VAEQLLESVDRSHASTTCWYLLARSTISPLDHHDRQPIPIGDNAGNGLSHVLEDLAAA
jgi:hypothetical protein